VKVQTDLKRSKNFSIERVFVTKIMNLDVATWICSDYRLVSSKKNM